MSGMHMSPDMSGSSLGSSPRISSSPSAMTKCKPQSLNLASPGSGSLPRPLQLATSSIVSEYPAALSSPTSSPNPSSTSRSPVPRGATPTTPMGGQATGATHAESPLSPLSPTISSMKRKPNSRRQSSISYIPSHSPSQPTFSRRESADGHSLGFARSPLSSAHTTTTFSPGLGRSNSVGGIAKAKSPRIERSSTGSLLSHDSNSKEADAVKHLKERAPVTLAEKHAELLHFIAQKESKCLELRSQLAVHEAELLQLKRKWERIVNKGFGKSLSPSSSTSSSPSSPALPSLTSGSGLLSPSVAANVPGAVMLEGIKEGVQGVSRLIAAGIESIAGPSDAALPHPPAMSASAPLPLRLGSGPGRRVNGHHGHVQKESQSSSSTTFSNASGSSLLSASTVESCATSVTSGSSTSGPTAKSTPTDHAADEDEAAESEFGDFEDGMQQRRRSSVEDVLMVRDTGATPTMSPNPDFQRKKADRSRGSGSSSPSKKGNGVIPSSLVLDQEEEVMKNDFDWDDGWGDAASSEDQSLPSDQPRMNASTSTPSTPSNSRLGTTATAPAFPGAGLSTMGMTGPSAQQVSSWVGSVGKKWGEIKGSPTFSKNQKRASLLISDMQQSLVSALISPPPNSSSSSLATPSFALSSSTSRSNLFEISAPSPTKPSVGLKQPHPQQQQQQLKRQPSSSLLDDSDDESYGEGPGLGDSALGEDDDTVRMKSGVSVPVLVPNSFPSVGVRQGTTTTTATPSSKTNKDADEEEWNW